MVLWTEKYEPHEISEIISNECNARVLNQMILSKRFTHFVLTGPIGTGKSTLLKAFIKHVSTGDNILWINQSWLKTIESKEKFFFVL